MYSYFGDTTPASHSHGFSRPFRTCSWFTLNPALKRRTIVKCPSHPDFEPVKTDSPKVQSNASTSLLKRVGPASLDEAGGPAATSRGHQAQSPAEAAGSIDAGLELPAQRLAAGISRRRGSSLSFVAWVVFVAFARPLVIGFRGSCVAHSFSLPARTPGWVRRY